MLQAQKWKKNLLKNHVMTSSLRHFTIHEDLPISNNLRSFSIIASLLRELYDFKKCTFNAASRDLDDVFDLKLHTYTVNVCVQFKVITTNFTTDIFKKSILKSFNLPLEGAVAICDVINILYELSTLARHLRHWKATL